MFKLFWLPYGMSMNVQLLLEELGLSYELEKINRSDKTELLRYNPKGHVPTLIVDNTQVLTEAMGILVYLADKYPNGKFIPAEGSDERYQCFSWLAFWGYDIHKSMSFLIRLRKMFTPEIKQAFYEQLDRYMKHIDNHLAKNSFLVSDLYTIADMYTITLNYWVEIAGFDLAPYKNLEKYMERLGNREAVQTTIALQKSKEKHQTIVK